MLSLNVVISCDILNLFFNIQPTHRKSCDDCDDCRYYAENKRSVFHMLTPFGISLRKTLRSL